MTPEATKNYIIFTGTTIKKEPPEGQTVGINSDSGKPEAFSGNLEANSGKTEADSMEFSTRKEGRKEGNKEERKDDKEGRKEEASSSPEQLCFSGTDTGVAGKEGEKLEKLRTDEKLRQVIGKWFAYKTSSGEKLNGASEKAFETLAVKNAWSYGIEEVAALVDQSISNGWKGVYWEKLAAGTARAGAPAGRSRKNRFINFEQREWDWDEMERLERQYIKDNFVKKPAATDEILKNGDINSACG